MNCPTCRRLVRHLHPYHVRMVDDERLLRRARQIQAQPTPRFNGTRNAELTELAHAYGISLRTLQRYLAK